MDELMGASVVPMAKVFTYDAEGRGWGWMGFGLGTWLCCAMAVSPQGGWVGMVISVADGGKRWWPSLAVQ